MALYAELHHERYDGAGYYSVPQREIPVEAHVLIVADSFDAMTSKRAYRPALTAERGRARAARQGRHPVPPDGRAAFAAMIEGKDVEPAMGAHQLAALRAEFSRIPVVSMPSWRNILTSSALAVAMVATALITFGATSIPRWVDAGVLGIAFLSGFYWAAGMWLLARRRARVSKLPTYLRRRRARCVRDDGGSSRDTIALAAKSELRQLDGEAALPLLKTTR